MHLGNVRQGGLQMLEDAHGGQARQRERAEDDKGVARGRSSLLIHRHVRARMLEFDGNGRSQAGRATAHDYDLRRTRVVLGDDGGAKLGVEALHALHAADVITRTWTTR